MPEPIAVSRLLARSGVARGTVSAMTFNDNASVGGNTARRRGGGHRGRRRRRRRDSARSPSCCSTSSPAATSRASSARASRGRRGGGSEIANCETGADANAQRRLPAGRGIPRHRPVLGRAGRGLPRSRSSSSSTARPSTQCGTASNQTGPFYCPPEETVYVDPTFFALLRERFDATAGPLAQLYVLAHEYGHHVQQITGIMQEHPNNGTGPDSNGVRTELQADCFAGAWVGDMTEQVDENGVPFLEAPTQQQIADAINAAQTVGDDHIQQESGGVGQPRELDPRLERAAAALVRDRLQRGRRAPATPSRFRGQPVNEHLDDILYPPIEPYETGELIVGDGNRVYWEQSGNPDGKPVVFLHGGPGAGTSAWHRRFFDPERYRIVLFDQRGCGRSHAARERAGRRSPPQHDVAPRRRHGAAAPQPRHRAWQVFGGSWGSALALAYAETHPDAVTELVLRGIFTLRRHELEWFYEGGASVDLPRPVGGLHRADPGARALAADRGLPPAAHRPRSRGARPGRRRMVALGGVDAHAPARRRARRRDDGARRRDRVRPHREPLLPARRLVRGGQLIDGVDAIRGIPAVIVQGRYDVCTPIMTAWDLHRAWPEAEFVVVPRCRARRERAGHRRGARAATDRFAADARHDGAEGRAAGVMTASSSARAPTRSRPGSGRRRPRR